MSNLEIAKLNKRISILENINNVKNDDFSITSPNHIVIDKNYYIKTTSPIYVTFKGYLTSNGTDNLTFKANILDNNGDILHYIDKNIDLNSRFNFDITIDIMKDILNKRYILLSNIFNP